MSYKPLVRVGLIVLGAVVVAAGAVLAPYVGPAIGESITDVRREREARRGG